MSFFLTPPPQYMIFNFIFQKYMWHFLLTHHNTPRSMLRTEKVKVVVSQKLFDLLSVVNISAHLFTWQNILLFKALAIVCDVIPV